MADPSPYPEPDCLCIPCLCNDNENRTSESNGPETKSFIMYPEFRTEDDANRHGIDEMHMQEMLHRTRLFRPEALPDQFHALLNGEVVGKHHEKYHFYLEILLPYLEIRNFGKYLKSLTEAEITRQTQLLNHAERNLLCQSRSQELRKSCIETGEHLLYSSGNVKFVCTIYRNRMRNWLYARQKENSR